MRELQQRLGMTMVYVTHDQAEAMTMADQVVLMNKGRIEQDGRPRELYAARRRLRRALHRHAADEPAARWTAASVAAATPPVAPRPLSLGVRPEAVALGGPRPACRPAVQSLEYLGADTGRALRVGDQTSPCACRQAARCRGRAVGCMGRARTPLVRRRRHRKRILTLNIPHPPDRRCQQGETDDGRPNF
jgi:ABC-type sugar transport system ATPase subunit